MHDLLALVVDDSKVGRLTMMKKLEAFGVRVDLAESGQQALDYVAQNQPDLIFMDHMMPDMDGFEVTRRIKAAPGKHHIPVVIVSGNDEVSFLEQARAVGAIDAITKPPATEVLTNLLNALPKLAAAAQASAPVEVPPPPPAVSQPAASQPAPTPGMDRAEVHALVERLLGGAMEHLHTEVTTDVGKQLQAAADIQRQALQETSQHWRDQLAEATAGMAELRRAGLASEALNGQLNALAQRLPALEAELGKPKPDGEALQAQMEQRIAAGQADLLARIERLEALLDNLRQESQAGLAELNTQIEQRSGDFDGRVEWLSTGLSQLTDQVQSEQARQDQRSDALVQRLDRIDNAEPASGLDAEQLQGAIDAQLAPQLEALRNAFTAQLEEHQSRPLDENLAVALLAPVQEQLVALRAEADGWRIHAEALEQTQNALQADLAAQGEALAASLADERNLLARLEQQQSQLDSLDTQQGQLDAWDDVLNRLQDIEQRLDDAPQTDVEAGVQRVLEQRIAQMREVINAALQPAYPGLEKISVAAIEQVPPDSKPDSETSTPPFNSDGGHLQAEVAQLKNRLKVLTITLAAGGALLLVAVGALLIRG